MKPIAQSIARRIAQHAAKAAPAIAAVLALGALAACAPVAPQAAGTSLTAWPARQLLFAGDTGSGALRVFHLVGGRPVPVAMWNAAGRGEVHDVRVDSLRGGVWVLGETGLDFHAAADGALLARAAVPAALRARALSIDDQGRLHLAGARGGHRLMAAAH